MPGFGSGNFGNELFGQGGWAKRVFFDYMPEIYRDQDAVSGGYLQKFSEGIRESFDELRIKIENLNDLRDPLRVQTNSTNSKNIKLGSIVTPKGAISQRGIDGTVTAFGEFKSNTARFTSADIGKEIFISRSTIPANNRKCTIISIINNKTVVTLPTLSPTTNVFRWELRDRVQAQQDRQTFEIRLGDISDVTADWDFTDGVAQAKIIQRELFSTTTGIQTTLTEREGSDGLIDSSGRFRSSSAKLSAKDIGKFITISEASEESNNGKYQILDVDVISPTDIRAVFSRIFYKGEDKNGGIIYTVLNGVENIRIKHVKSGINTSLSAAVEDNTDIVITLATDSSGDVTTTAGDIVTLLTSDLIISELISFVATGTGLGISKEHDFIDPQNGVLAEDTTTFIWAILPFPQITIKKLSPPLGVVEQEGIDASITNNSINSPVAIFTDLDVGKIITIAGSTTATNNGNFEILSITDANTVVIDEVLTTEAGPLCWELRGSTRIGDLTQVNIKAPSFIVHLGRDFGLEIDEREVERRQRAFISSCNQWFDKKGTAEGYEILGKISGFDVEAFALYRISRSLAVSGLDFEVIEVGTNLPGKLGTDGSINYQSTGDIYFSSPTASFSQTDVDSAIRVQNANNSDNNSVFTILAVIDSNTVQLDPDEGAQTDLNNGSLSWAVIKLYTTQAPTLPNYDEINTDLMSELVGTPPDYPEFTADKFCWEEDMIDFISVTIDNDPAVTKFLYTNRVQITVSGNMDVVSAIGNWYIEDDDGTRFYLETMPIESPPASGIYTIEAIASALPTTGGTLHYDCPVNLLCIYCAASKVFLTIEANDILNDAGVALEKIFERLLERFNEVKPVHVQIVPRYVQPIEITFNMGVTLNPGLFKQEIIIPFGAYFDMIPADAIPGDTQIYVEVETP